MAKKLTKEELERLGRYRGMDSSDLAGMLIDIEQSNEKIRARVRVLERAVAALIKK